MGTGVYLLIVSVIAASQPLFARAFTCEDVLARPSFESVRKQLKKKYPVVFRPLLKVDRGRADATHEVADSRHIFRFADDFKYHTRPYQLSILIHETVHLATARHFEAPESDVVAARGIEISDTSFEIYEDLYGFDELEARIREMALLTQAAENYETIAWEAEDKGRDIRRHIVFQRLAIRKTLEWIDAGETVIEIGGNSVGLEIKNCERRTFCKMEVPLRADTHLNSDEEAYEYIRRILAVRSNSLDIKLEVMRGLFKRLDAF